MRRHLSLALYSAVRLTGPAEVIAIGTLKGEVGATEIGHAGDVLGVLPVGLVALRAPAVSRLAIQRLRGGSPAVATTVGAEEDAVSAAERRGLTPCLVTTELALWHVRTRPGGHQKRRSPETNQT